MNSSGLSIETYDIPEVHTYVGEKSKTSDFFVYSGDDVPVQEKMFRPARSVHFALHLSLSDGIEINYNLINYKLQENSIFIIHPGIVHSVREAVSLPALSMGFTHNFFGGAMVHKKHAEALRFLSVQSDPLFLLTHDEAQLLHGLMLYLKNMVRHNDHPFQQDLIQHGFNLFMLEMAAIAKKYRGSNEPGTNRKEDILLHFLKELAEHFKEERSVQYYADKLFMTPKHLTKTVKELTNKTCGEFIDEMVITEAKILLSDLSYSVAQAADYLHFSDQFFFSKFFKRRTGLSPKEYKNSL